MIHKILSFAPALLLMIFITVSNVKPVYAQDWKTDKKIAVLFGLTQPLIVKGFNIEGNYIHNRFIVDYSHGVSLDFAGDMLTPELKDQQLAVHIPWTTGFGVGYRFTHWLNLRVEPKWHRFEFYYDGETQSKENQITGYNTFSLGAGLYGFFQPFKRQENFLKGITIAPSVRFWPTVNSSLLTDEYVYSNKITGANEKIGTLDPGFGFTPLVINISVGYSFSLKRNK
jgi:hypothetical protein